VDHPANDKYPGIRDGVQRWYTIHGTIRSLYWTGTAAISLFDRVYLGVSGNLILSEINTIRARTVSDDNLIVQTNGNANEGRSWLKASGWQGSFGVGVQVEAIPDELLFGVSYQARPGVIGGMGLEGTLHQVLSNAPKSETEVQLLQDMADIYRIGVSYRPTEKLELRLFADWQRWSAMQGQCIVKKVPGTDEFSECPLIEEGPNKGASTDANAKIVQNLPREWNDTFGIRAGVSYWVKPEIEIMAGLGYDSNAVPDHTLDAALVDFHDISVSLGGRFQLVDWFFLSAGYTHFFYVPRNTTGAEAQDGYPSPSTGPDATGNYWQWIGALNLNAHFQFDVMP